MVCWFVQLTYYWLQNQILFQLLNYHFHFWIPIFSSSYHWSHSIHCRRRC
uniref:Transcription factor bHLH79-like isoform X3 n=1 Tax=Rhizophora mucronata TaxID=61149 RepID=A0A2P2Q380_RHIMU